MPQYNFFGATTDDVLRRLRGDAGPFAPSEVEAAMNDAEARIEAALPDRLRRLLSRVEGEVIVLAASDGQAEAPLGLPAASGLALYADLACPYPDRTPADAMPASAYTLDDAGEKVTFSPPLSLGTRVVADYTTSLAAGVRVLADLLAYLAAADLARSHVRGQPEAVQAMLAGAEARLAALAEGDLAVPELDALTLYDDWERAPRGIRAGELVRS